MRILLHCCCGPCAIFPVQALQAKGHEVTGFFYNPNIHPYKEYEKRLENFLIFAHQAGIKTLVKDDYDLDGFLRLAAGRESQRCIYCYEMRLRETAREAREQGYDGFCTSLLVSPYQNQENIMATGRAAGSAWGIPFYEEDFRPGYRTGVQASKDMGLYRQPYCGCIYSERDRYRKEKK